MKFWISEGVSEVTVRKAEQEKKILKCKIMWNILHTVEPLITDTLINEHLQ
jgi:hypothetical protein